MKIEMKKYFLLLFLLLFYNNTAIAQGPPEPPCSCCTELEPEDPSQPSEEYTACVNECLAGNDPCVPIDSAHILLFFAGISLGVLIVNKNRITKNNMHN